jgi:hypothetical protein
LKGPFLLAIFIGLLAAPVFAQHINRDEIDMEAYIEQLFAIQEEDINYEDLYESLLQMQLNPISLNLAGPEELQSLFVLTPLQVTAFLNYRKTLGPFISLYELQAIPHWDLETIQRVLPFVTLSQTARTHGQPLIQRMLSERDAYLILRHRRVWQTRRGYLPADTLASGRLSTRFQGDPNDLYARFRVQHAKDFSLGFTLDKDPGEVFAWDPKTNRYGFNFISYHATVYEKGPWKTLSLGDYQLQFGQGLVFGAGFSVGKGAETITTVRRSTVGIRPYTSVLEFGFFRGAAATYQKGGWEFTGMYSNAPRDARVQENLDTLDRQESYISSLLRSGLHRTSSEIAAKSQAREQNIGGNIQYHSPDKNLQWGANFLFTEFSQPFIPLPRIYNTFEFSGRDNLVYSTYFSYNFLNYFFFGEGARSKSGGQGAVLGMMSSLHPKVDLSLLWRQFDRDFHTFYGNAFSEGTRPINETGIYLGLQYKPSRKFNWSVYHDQFRFPWMRFRVYRPSSGTEWLSRVSYTPSRATLLFLQFRNESKDRNLPSVEQSEHSHLVARGRRRNFVLSLEHRLNNTWQIKSRVQASDFQFGNQSTKGYALVQDLNAEMGRVRLGGRIALFDTEDFENRQYIYERNVLWAFSLPNYHGQGMRYYFLGQWKISPQLTFWGRWARTAFTDRKTIGSGLQQIEGPYLSETTMQLRYQFNR